MSIHWSSVHAATTTLHPLWKTQPISWVKKKVHKRTFGVPANCRSLQFPYRNSLMTFCLHSTAWLLDRANHNAPAFIFILGKLAFHWYCVFFATCDRVHCLPFFTSISYSSTVIVLVIQLTFSGTHCSYYNPQVFARVKANVHTCKAFFSCCTSFWYPAED
jgi:hypothetical protein